MLRRQRIVAETKSCGGVVAVFYLTIGAALLGVRTSGCQTRLDRLILERGLPAM
jgi:hypothetical protein